MLPASDLQTIVGIALACATLLGIVFGWFRKAWLWLKVFFSQTKPGANIQIPKKSFLVQHAPRDDACEWSLGESAGKRSMHITGDIQISNIASVKVAVASVRLSEPSVRGFVLISRREDRGYSDQPIPPGEMAYATFNFWVTPPFRNPGESFEADISVVDQFGNDHWLKKLQFRSVSP